MKEMCGRSKTQYRTHNESISDRIHILLVAVYFGNTGILFVFDQIVNDKKYLVYGLLFWSLLIISILADRTRLKPILVFAMILGVVAAYFGLTLVFHPEYKPYYMKRFVGVWDELFSPVTGCIYGFLIIILAERAEVIWNGLKGTAWLNLAYYLMKIYQANKVGYWIRTVETGKTIHSTYDMGVGYGMIFVAVIFLCQFFKERRIWALLLSAVSAFLALQNGSRGALMCYAFCVILLILCKGDSCLYEKKQLIRIGLLTVSCGVGLVGFNGITTTVGSLLVKLGVHSRTVTAMAEGTLLAGNGRSTITELALTAIKDAGFTGLGAFGDRPYIAPYFWWGYCHNIALEILCDFGVVLGLILITLLIVSLLHVVISPKTDAYRYVFIVFASMFSKLFISDTIWGYTRFWALLGLIYLFYYKERTRKFMYHNAEPLNNRNLKTLSAFILRKWRQILCTGILLGLLLGGFSILNGVLSWDDDMSKFEADLEVYYEEYAFYEDEMAAFKQEQEALRDKADDLQHYVDNSVLMNLDAKNKLQVTADILVTLDSSVWEERYSNLAYDPTDTLITLYAGSITKGVDWAQVAEVSGIDAEYISELVGTSENLESNILTIVVSHPDADTATAILDELLAQLSSRYDTMAANVGTHTVTVVNRMLETVKDDELLGYQNMIYDTLSSYKNAEADYQEQIDNSYAPSWPNSEPSRRQICFWALLYGILGFLAGSAAFICWRYIQFVYSGKLYTGSDLKELLGIYCLGALVHLDEAATEKRPFSRIDRWIQNLDKENVSVSDEEALQWIVLNLKNRIGNARKLFVTGTVNEEELKKVQNMLQVASPDMEIYFGRNAANDVKVYQTIVSCDVVILAEMRGHSRLKDILQEKEFVYSINKDLTGCILL